MERFMQKLEKSEGKHRNAQSLQQKYLKIARYSFAIFNTNLARFCVSEPNILNRTQVNNYNETVKTENYENTTNFSNRRKWKNRT